MANDHAPVDDAMTSTQSKLSMMHVEIAAHFFVSVSWTYETSTSNVPEIKIALSVVS
jgi:hypothetical protein